MPTRVYADTSAVVKLFIAEPESTALREWLKSQAQPSLVSSALLGVELIRVLSLMNPDSVPVAERFLAIGVDIVEITPPTLADAAKLPPPRLRTLDSIHLATAVDLAESIDVVLTYDKLLIEAARLQELRVEAPGAGY